MKACPERREGTARRPREAPPRVLVVAIPHCTDTPQGPRPTHDDRLLSAALIALMPPLELLIAQARIDGLPDTAIADRMQLSPNGITQHRTRLRRRI